MADAVPLLGAVLELDVGGPAHGGSCVARLAGAGGDDDGGSGRVVFVRHALPGERVRARVTEDRGGAYCFADAVEILTASPDRVTAPCPYAAPGLCGGCDWQHAAGPAQRRLKAQVVVEQFRRIAHLDVAPLLAGVRELPGGLLGWRTRNLYAVDGDGRPGLRRHRSHDIEHVERCLLGVPGVGDSGVLAETWPGLSGIEVVRGDSGETAVLSHRPGAGRHPRGRRPPDRVEQLTGPGQVHRTVLGRDFAVAAAGFWQVHPAAATVFAQALLDAVLPQPGERVLELYSGAGALSASLAEAVGRTGSVLTVDSGATAVADARKNLRDLPQVQVRQARVTAQLVGEQARPPVDIVVLDPPRAGAGRDVIEAITALRPRVIGYVACDPAALARDVAVACGKGHELASLTAFDAFPMTHHIECLAVLRRMV